MIIVIADDITGAAEIAGTALRHGLKASLVMGSCLDLFTETDVAVIATDTRSMSTEDATNELSRISGIIGKNNVHSSSDGITVFKKTDSVLRGHIGAEINVLMSCLAYHNALLIAQNPSKKRVIRDGMYFVDGIPLSDTLFSIDPEYPAFTSRATDIVGYSSRPLALNSEIDSSAHVIYVADASTQEEVRLQISKTEKHTLIAGGADAFMALLDLIYGEDTTPNPQSFVSLLSMRGRTLAVCGSTQTKPLLGTPFMMARGAQETCIPDDVFEGASSDFWNENVAAIYKATKCLVIRVGEHEIRGAEYALRLKQVMAGAAKAAVETCQTECLIIEGGATAFTTLSTLGWNTFSVESELAPGVVAMRHDDTLVILKPGSYPWGGLFGCG